ncbi:hypothetical protein J6R97_04365 [bacterium]|nr:hypothetical protein [bacterium]
MKKHFLISALLLNSFIINPIIASVNYNYTPTENFVNNNVYYQQPLQYPQNNTLQGNVVMVPAGTSINAMLTAPLSSQYNLTGQTVSLALNNDFYYGERLIAPAGSTIYGTIIEASKAKRGGINGKVCVRFSQIFTPYGTQIPISAVFKTLDSSGILVGGTKVDVAKEYTKDLAAGSAAGALSGLVFGALAGGDVGRGAALGTAVGAGGGLVKSIWDKGNDVEIPVSATMDIVLTQPITVSSTSYYQEN